MAVLKIVEFLFERLGELFYVMNQFEIFPNVGFGTLVVVLTILSFLLSLFMDNVYSDFINYDNTFARGPKIFKKYDGKHTPDGYKPKHNSKEAKRRGY